MGGSKKRKAAKKKKASQLNTTEQHNKNNVVVENDELKNQEERDSSDSGEKEVVSPAILQGNPNPFTGGSEELERRDELPPVQSNSSETERGDGVDIDDGTQIVVEVEEVIKSESNEVECIEDVSELGSKTDEVVLDAASDSLLVSKESAAEVNDAVENSLVVDTVESVAAAVSEKITTEYVVENPKDSETMLNTSSKVEETGLDASDVSILIVEQDEKPLPVSEGSIARSIGLVENTKSPETFQKNQQPLVAAPIQQLVVEKTSWLGCCGMFDLLRGGR